MLTPTLVVAALALVAAQEAPQAAKGPLAGLSAAAAPSFPVAKEDLALAWPADGTPPTMLELAVRYGELTGQRLLFDEETRQYLTNARIPIDRPTTVAARELQGFFETVLAAADFVMTLEREAEPRLIRLYSLQTAQRNIIRSSARIVDANNVELLRDHPAMLFTTVVDLPNVDVRQLSNSMRTMITDANTMQMLPAGNATSMILTGFGPRVADLCDQLRLIDASSARPKAAVVHEFLRLQHASAVDAAPIIERALASARGQRDGANAAAAAQQGVVMPPSPGPTVVAEPRLNGLLVTCLADELAEAKRVIALLDVK